MSPEETPSHTWALQASEIMCSRTSKQISGLDEAISPFELSLLTGMMAHPHSSFTTEPSTSSVQMEWSQEHMI